MKTEANENCLINALFKVKGQTIHIRANQDDWLALHAVSIVEKMPLEHLISLIDETRPTDSDLSAAVRIFVRNYLRAFADKAVITST